MTRDAIAAVEQDGIVFIDEIDKIVSSAETRLGAQRLARSPSTVVVPQHRNCILDAIMCTKTLSKAAISP